jgi:hypothetical protein
VIAARFNPFLEMTGCPVFLVEVSGIGNVEVAHEFLEVSHRGFQEEMKVIVHQDEGDEVYAIDINEAVQEIKKPASVMIGTEEYAVFRSLYR